MKMKKEDAAYISIEEAAKKTNLTPRRIQQLCKTGKIDGALFDGFKWMIPESSLIPLLISKKIISPKPLPIGVSDFKKASSEYCYVDKTLLIKDIIDSRPEAILFTRPRRFGKTLNMDMLRVFFEKTNQDNSIYFWDKAIWNCGDFYQKEQGKYPVVYLSLKDLKFSNWKETYAAFKTLVRGEYKRHAELRESDALSEYEKSQYAEIMEERDGEDETLFSFSLAVLTELLFKHHGVKPVIIIDEYDTPIERGHFYGFYEEAVSFLRNFFSAALKDNKYISHAFITGVLKVAKESLFSGLNNLKTDSVLDRRYSEYFGFTEKEVKAVLSSYGKGSRFKEARDWYDGYLFGDTKIFNPWSIMNYVDDGCVSPRPYWVDTGNNELIGEIIKNLRPEEEEKLKEVLEGKSILSPIDLDVIYPDVSKNPDTVYSFLLVAGYLSTARISQYGDLSYAELVIPNREVKTAFEKEILGKFGQIIKSSSALRIQVALLEKDGVGLEKELGNLLKESISFNDASSEAFYHGLTLGLCAAVNNFYFLRSNRESGDGRFDICLEPKEKRLPGIIIEIKASKKDDPMSLEELAKEALCQIEGKSYETELMSRGVEDIYKIAIAYSGKTVKVAREGQFE